MAEKNYKVLNRTSAEISLPMTSKATEKQAQARYIDAEGRPVVVVAEVETASFAEYIRVPASALSQTRNMFAVGGGGPAAAQRPSQGYVVMEEANYNRLKAEASFKDALLGDFIKVERTDENPGRYEAG
jgi:hypothetical protein